ncbi:ComF family protein [Youngiibacter multivorans]|uniref:Amidophosphoribosyltransferase n=1 Tax=Youngiibacter multivorans TaxID=937251 RepID=A0ABS4G7K0_9CLOT|nr:putative amidophosphoribosyltransferase [Youngiibacter multivorans]
MGKRLHVRIIEGIIDTLYPRLRCPVCGEYYDGLCPVCRLTIVPADEAGILHCSRYEGSAKALISAFKSRGSFNAAREIAAIMHSSHGDYIRSFDMVTWAPSSKISRKRLGFDHGEVLARNVARLQGIECKRLFSAPAYEQKGLERTGRQENALTIGLIKNKKPLIKGRKILIVDDVATTGSTLLICTERINEAGGIAGAIAFAYQGTR